jgi:hypothetical protein
MSTTAGRDISATRFRRFGLIKINRDPIQCGVLIEPSRKIGVRTSES